MIQVGEQVALDPIRASQGPGEFRSLGPWGSPWPSTCSLAGHAGGREHRYVVLVDDGLVAPRNDCDDSVHRAGKLHNVAQATVRKLDVVSDSHRATSHRVSSSPSASSNDLAVGARAKPTA